MLTRRHGTASSFLDAARDHLLASEAENHLILGLAGEIARAEHATEGEGPLLVTVSDPGRVVGCALRTPPLNLILTAMSAEAVETLVEDLLAADVDVPGVIGPASSAHRFVELWSSRRSLEARPGIRQGIYQLTAVEEGLRPCPGHLRQAGPADADRVAAWIRDFVTEAGTPVGPPREVALEKIGRGAVFLWNKAPEHGGEPVAMAAWAGPTQNGVRVNLVYTPPELRGRGYATACVAALSRRLLDEGRRFCFLYTDLDNPTSNKIYTRIGYRPVCDVSEYRFE